MIFEGAAHFMTSCWIRTLQRVCVSLMKTNIQTFAKMNVHIVRILGLDARPAPDWELSGEQEADAADGEAWPGGFAAWLEMEG